MHVSKYGLIISLYLLIYLYNSYIYSMNYSFQYIVMNGFDEMCISKNPESPTIIGISLLYNTFSSLRPSDAYMGQ